MTTTRIQEAAAGADFGRAWARKSGRTERLPYVPVLVVKNDVGTEIQCQIRGLAYISRGDAVEAAQRHIDRARADLAERLADPRQRALREQYGLPREIGDV